MDYKITPMFPFEVIGFQKEFDNGTAYTEIPKFWDSSLYISWLDTGE